MFIHNRCSGRWRGIVESWDGSRYATWAVLAIIRTRCPLMNMAPPVRLRNVGDLATTWNWPMWFTRLLYSGAYLVVGVPPPAFGPATE
jgi:hypothetical protein